MSLFKKKRIIRLDNPFINLKLKIMSEIESKVVSIIVDKLGVDAAEVKPEASFTNDLGADSLDTVELIMELEKELRETKRANEILQEALGFFAASRKK